MADTTAKICIHTHWQGGVRIPEGLVVGALDPRVNAYFVDYVVTATS